jgi:hypothetical protein
VNAVKDGDLLGGDGLGGVVDFDVEVAEALEVVAQAAIAFVEEIFVHCAFLKDGDDAAHALRIDLCAFNHHANGGALVSGEAEVFTMLVRQVGLGLEFDVRLETVLLLVVAQDAVESTVGGVVVDGSAGTKVGVVAELFRGHAGAACDLDGADSCLRSRDDPKGDVDELFFGVGGEGVSDGGLAEAVVGKCAAHLREGAGKLVVGVARAWAELAGALELGVDGGAFCAVDGDGADEGARRAAKGEGDAVVERRTRRPGLTRRVRWQRAGGGCCECRLLGAARPLPGEDGLGAERGDRVRYTFKCDAANGTALPASER